MYNQFNKSVKIYRLNSFKYFRTHPVFDLQFNLVTQIIQYEKI